MLTEKQKSNGEFYSRGGYVVRGKRFMYRTNGDSYSGPWTAGDLRAKRADIAGRIATKVRSPGAMANLEASIAEIDAALAIAEGRGL